MIKKLILSLSIVTIVLLVTMSCAPPTLTPTTTPEPEIPAHFTTHTSEGLFSISYPPDWVPATSVMEELFELAKEWIQSLDPEVTLEGAQMLFIGGLPIEGGWWPNVNLVVGPRSVGYWELDEIVEVESQWGREHLQEYREFSRIKTVIDAREATIIDSQDYNPDFGTCRYLQAYTVKGKHVWIVTCTVDAGDFKDYEHTFYSVVRSLRILK